MKLMLVLAVDPLYRSILWNCYVNKIVLIQHVSADAVFGSNRPLCVTIPERYRTYESSWPLNRYCTSHDLGFQYHKGSHNFQKDEANRTRRYYEGFLLYNSASSSIASFGWDSHKLLSQVTRSLLHLSRPSPPVTGTVSCFTRRRPHLHPLQGAMPN